MDVEESWLIGEGSRCRHAALRWYTPARLFLKYDTYNRRFGWWHPALPAIQALGWRDTCMGWMYQDAVQACAVYPA